VLALFLATMLWAASAPQGPTCSILVYHRFGPAVADSMTITTAVFTQQIQALRANGYQVVPLNRLVEVLQRQQTATRNLVAITVDDGHRTTFTELFPVIQSLDVPVTLFIYPSAIGHASNAMTWEQLRAMAAHQAVNIGAHTYWHPDFRQDLRRLGPAAYAKSVAMQLGRPRTVLHQKLEVNIRFMAWPYGIYDNDLQRQAQDSGYAAAFALGNRNASSSDSVFALPRHMIVDAVGVQGLLKRLAVSPACTQ
jgi:peptidoglycan/xylan/chitin deacetylase (PgdA/CDA1 family)